MPLELPENPLNPEVGDPPPVANLNNVLPQPDITNDDGE